MRLSRRPLILGLLLIAAAGPPAAARAELVADLETRFDTSFQGDAEPFVNFRGALYFWYTDPATGREPWRSDGTPAGTAILKDICPGRCSSWRDWPWMAESAAGDDAFYFNACDPARGCQMWRSDGTAAGTEVVESFGVPDGFDDFDLPQRPTVWNDDLYFLAFDPAAGVELIRSDGTPAGTAVVRDVVPGRDGGFFPAIAPAGDRLFLPSGFELWSSDGTDEGTRLVMTLPDPSGAFFYWASALGDLGLFPTSDDSSGLAMDLWRSDGTAAGTLRVRELHPPPGRSYFLEPCIRSRPLPFRELTAAGGRLFFVLQTEEHGEEPWTSDGTAEGTRLLRDVRPGPMGSFPRHLTAQGDRLVFAADDGETGHEPWSSDGTAAGTERLADVHPGRGSSFPESFTAVDGRIVFAAADGTSGSEPWVTDLTSLGTRRVADVDPGPAPSSPKGFHAFGDRVYFNAGTSGSGFELFAFPRYLVVKPTPRLPDRW